jgi:hypothetical protein
MHKARQFPPYLVLLALLLDGVSYAARGKGVCHDGQCDFLIAVPVKSFDSGGSNRDIHVVQVTRGAEFP